MRVSSFDRYAGWLSILAGVTGIGYALAFVVLEDARLGAVFLTLAPLLAVAGLVAVFERVREIEPGYATLALALGAFGSLAASTHGAYDLANVLNPPAELRGVSDLAFPTDPRGYGTFGLTGIALALLSTLARRTPEIPGWVGPLGLVLGLVLVITWLARLIVVDATSMLVLGPALVSGLLSPIFFLLLGTWLLGWRR